MSLNAENELLLGGIEAVYGTAEVLTGADAIQCDIDPSPMEADQKTREFSRPYFGARPVIHTKVHRACRLSNIELAGSGDPSVAPQWAKILRGCGWAATTTPTETTLLPVTKDHESMTLNPVLDGQQFQMIGAKGNSSLKFNEGEFPTIEADFKGGWVTPETLGAVPTPDYSNWKIPRPVSCAHTPIFVLHGVAYAFYELTIDQGSEVDFYCLPGDTGSRFEIGKRDITGKVKLQAKTITEHDIFTAARNDTPGAFSLVHGTVAGEIITLAAPSVQLRNPKPSSYQNQLAWECDLSFLPVTGDDELSITAA